MDRVVLSNRRDLLESLARQVGGLPDSAEVGAIDVRFADEDSELWKGGLGDAILALVRGVESDEVEAILHAIEGRREPTKVLVRDDTGF